MRISEQWLRELVDVELSTDRLAEQLTMAGLEVDSIESVAPDFTGVVVAEIIECEQHPDADKLRVCKVNIGSDEEPVQIVCGAPNARKGLKVPLATIGGVLPENFKIKKAKLRGVQSFGMLCSAKEIGLADSADGLFELPVDAPIGADIREYLQLNDTVIEVDLTPNRGDCLGMMGVAREVGVIGRADISPLQIPEVAAVIDDTFPIEITATEDCPRYVGRVIKGVNTSASTPMWMKEKLRRGGIRSLSPTVDITNYILLEMGQPMHAFDLAKLDSGIVVRKAASSENIELLDGQQVDLTENTLVIADHKSPQAMAGVMGGELSSVTTETTDIFLESAFFTPRLIAGKARSYGLHTDSSHRFERGVDPELQRKAIERATALVIEIAGGEPGPVSEVICEEHMPVKEAITLRKDRIKRLLGVEVADIDVEDILSRLGMAVTNIAEGWSVIAPKFRFDVEIEADIIEEIGRVYGYNNIPTTQATSCQTITPIPEACVPFDKVQDILVNRGYQEAVTYSFVCPKTQNILNSIDESISVANPISADMSVMRTTIWSGLLKSAVYNRNRQQNRIRFFESGLVFKKVDRAIIQKKSLAGVVCGQLTAEQWGIKSADVDFFDVKGDVEAILGLTNSLASYSFESAKHEALHPGQTARIIRDEKHVGWIGTIHPAVAKSLDLPTKTFMFELDVDGISQGSLIEFEKISKFPSIRRDLAVVVKESVSVDAVLKSAADISSEILHEVGIFDVYRGNGIEKDCKSLAISLILRHFSRTLIDNEVDEVVEQVIARLSQDFDATLRN